MRTASVGYAMLCCNVCSADISPLVVPCPARLSAAQNSLPPPSCPASRPLGPPSICLLFSSVIRPCPSINILLVVPCHLLRKRKSMKKCKEEEEGNKEDEETKQPPTRKFSHLAHFWKVKMQLLATSALDVVLLQPIHLQLMSINFKERLPCLLPDLAPQHPQHHDWFSPPEH